MKDKIPPHNIDAELAIVGSLLLDQSLINATRVSLEAKDFYNPALGIIYKTQMELFEQGKPVDTTTLSGKLKASGKWELCGGASGIIKLTESVVSPSRCLQHVQAVKESAAMRRMILLLARLKEKAFEDCNAVEYLAECRKSITEESNTLTDNKGPTQIDQALIDVLADIERGKPPESLITTGIDNIDQVCGGLWSSLVTVLAGRPGMGKSALMLNIAINVALRGKKVLLFSMEDAIKYLGMRALSKYGKINIGDIRRYNVHADDYGKLTNAGVMLNNMPLWIQDKRGLRARDIYSQSITQKNLKGLDLIIIDHLGEITQRGDQKVSRTEDAAREVADLANDLDVPVLLGVQLNRAVEGRQDLRPRLSDLKWSGAVEEVARMIWFIYRPAYYLQDESNNAELLIGKNNHGSTSMVKLWTQMQHMHVDSWDNDKHGDFPIQKIEKNKPNENIF